MIWVCKSVFFKVCTLMRVVTSKWSEAKWNYRHKDKIKKKKKQWTENLGDNSNSVKSCGIWPNCSFFTYASDRVRLFTRSEDSTTVCVHTHIHTSILPYDSVYACVSGYSPDMKTLWFHTCVCVYIHTYTHPSSLLLKK